MLLPYTPPARACYSYDSSALSGLVLLYQALYKHSKGQLWPKKKKKKVSLNRQSRQWVSLGESDRDKTA